MNENIDLTKILEGCPVGTKFYSSIYGEVEFVGIIDNSYYPIKIATYTKINRNFRNGYCTKDGKDDYNYDGECTLFPSKNQRDWNKFERFWDKTKVERFDVNTFQPFDKILVKDATIGVEWEGSFFCYIDHHYCNGIVCINGQMRYMAIPYNEETKHLLGTTKDCPDYYKWWED